MTTSWNNQISEIVQFRIAADKYGIDRLKIICEMFIGKNLTKNNVTDILILADAHSCTQLKTLALEFINTYIKDVKDTSRYKSMRNSHPQLIEDCYNALAEKLEVGLKLSSPWKLKTEDANFFNSHVTIFNVFFCKSIYWFFDNFNARYRFKNKTNFFNAIILHIVVLLIIISNIFSFIEHYIFGTWKNSLKYRQKPPGESVLQFITFVTVFYIVLQASQMPWIYTRKKQQLDNSWWH